jgi:hypothetical protein
MLRIFIIFAYFHSPHQELDPKVGSASVPTIITALHYPNLAGTVARPTKDLINGSKTK